MVVILEDNAGPGGDGFDDLDDVLVMLVGEQGRFDGLVT